RTPRCRCDGCAPLSRSARAAGFDVAMAHARSAHAEGEGQGEFGAVGHLEQAELARLDAPLLTGGQPGHAQPDKGPVDRLHRVALVVDTREPDPGASRTILEIAPSVGDQLDHVSRQAGAAAIGVDGDQAVDALATVAGPPLADGFAVHGEAPARRQQTMAARVLEDRQPLLDLEPVSGGDWLGHPLCPEHLLCQGCAYPSREVPFLSRIFKMRVFWMLRCPRWSATHSIPRPASRRCTAIEWRRE